MGKASKWLVNFLLGRKEDKGKRKNISISFEDGSVIPTPSATPTHATPFKRRWSFGKLGSKERAQKGSRSLDSITAAPLVKQAVLGLENRQDNNTKFLAMAMAVATSAAASRRKTRPTYAAGSSWVSRTLADAAATRIQAAFRAYLARKALHALRGLVKLQALVRGHLVRKQTTTTLRRMHALIAIQVRARFQRIQMAEESRPAVKCQSSRYVRLPQEIGNKTAQREAVDINLYENRGLVKSQKGVTTYYSGELSISNRERNYEEFSFTTHNSPRHSPPMSKPTPGRASFSSLESPYTPNYMAKTKSSRAKLRSQSEPKQRPIWNSKAKGKRTASAEEMDDRIQQHYDSSLQSKGVADENQEPWFVTLYRSTRRPEDNEGDTSNPTSYSEYRKSLVRNEPHATLF